MKALDSAVDNAKPEDDVTAVTSTNPNEDICHIEDGPHVTAVTSRRICCDSSVIRIIEDGKGEPLSIGRKSRVIPPPMRRALKVRDKNCRFHHRLVHEGGFGCEKDQDGNVVFTNELGQPISTSGYSLPPVKDNVVINLKQRLEDSYIHSQTCVTKWHGENMDRDLAVGNLWFLTRPEQH